MSTDSLRNRLEALSRNRPHVAPTARMRRRPPAPELRLEALLPGSVIANDSGTHYATRHRMEQFLAPLSAAITQFERQAARGQNPSGDRASTERAAFIDRFPHHTLFLDLETCGLAGSMIFLVGLLHHDDQGLVLEQLLARDYAEEQAVLTTLLDRLASTAVLVTFNGKSFDWPMVADRLTYHRLWRQPTLPPAEGVPPQDRRPAVHFDLLHHARRRWKQHLPDCKLQTLERFVCRRIRQDDIPGRDIPHAYHQFVRSGDARQIATIARHNVLDLVTLLEITLRVAG